MMQGARTGQIIVQLVPTLPILVSRLADERCGAVGKGRALLE